VNFRSLTRGGIWILILLFLSVPVSSIETPIMGVDAITRGMRGIGKTVFYGTKIDTFQVEILSVLKNQFGPKTNVILARLSGHSLEKTGGIQGMSGSPVYIDGKLIGAVAWGWSFSIDPVMGITPIGEMLNILDRPDHATLRSSVEPSPSSFGNSSHSDMTSLDHGLLTPVGTPVYVSGFSSDVVPELRDQIASYGLTPVQGAGGFDQSLPEASLEPGASLGVQLVRGDFNMTAIGTLTHIEGDRLVGFGHPMLFSGETRLPMTTAFIHEVIASQFISFKLGAGVKQVGAITQDRATGIGGVIGETAEMMPASITIRSVHGAQTYQMEVLRNRDLGPRFIQSAVVSSILTAEKAQGDATVNTRLSLMIEGQPELTFENIYSGTRGLGEGVLGVTRPLQLLMQNPFERIRVESAAFELEVAEDVKAARIQSIALDRSRFEPGDRVGVKIELRPYLDVSKIVESSIVIPSHVRSGTLVLRVSSAKSHIAQESKRIPANYRVSDVDNLVRVLKAEHRNDELIVELLANRAGATVGGVELSSLPPSVATAMKRGRHSGSVRTVNQTVVSESVTKTNFVLSGQQTVFLAVGTPGPGLRFSPGQPGPVPKKK
jgi:hypothetical protein